MRWLKIKMKRKRSWILMKLIQRFQLILKTSKEKNKKKKMKMKY